MTNPVSTSHNNLLGSSNLLIAAIAWGGMYSVSQTALEYLDPYSMTSIRYGIGALIFCVLLFLKEGLSAFRFDGQFLRLWLYGSCGFCGFSILLFHGLNHAPAEHGAVIASLMPLISTTINWIIYGKKPNPVTLICTLVAITGVILVISRGEINILLQLQAIKGDLMIVLGVTCWVVFSIGINQFPSWSPGRYTALSCCAGLITILSANLIASLVGQSVLPTMDQISPVLFEICYLIIIAGVLSVSCWSAGVFRLGELNALLFMNMIPVSAFAIAALQGKVIDPMEIYGMCLVICALLANNLIPRIQRTSPTGLSRYN